MIGVRRRENRQGWILISPYLLFGAIFFLIPLIWTLYLGFTNWNLISPQYDFVGIQNFLDAVADPKKSDRSHVVM